LVLDPGGKEQRRRSKVMPPEISGQHSEQAEWLFALAAPLVISRHDTHPETVFRQCLGVVAATDSFWCFHAFSLFKEEGSSLVPPAEPPARLVLAAFARFRPRFSSTQEAAHSMMGRLQRRRGGKAGGAIMCGLPRKQRFLVAPMPSLYTAAWFAIPDVADWRTRHYWAGAPGRSRGAWDRGPSRFVLSLTDHSYQPR
jgi:hypothetical protein